MYGWLCYIIAIILYAVDPISSLWIVALGVGVLFHFKYWVVGIIAFFVGAGYKKPF